MRRAKRESEGSAVLEGAREVAAPAAPATTTTDNQPGAVKTPTDNQEGNRRPHDAAGLLEINTLNQTKNAESISGRSDGWRVLRNDTHGAPRGTRAR